MPDVIYLHNKLREQQEIINGFSERIDELEQKFKSINNTREYFRKLNEESFFEAVKTIKINIKEMILNEFNLKFQQNELLLHEFIVKELNLSKDSIINASKLFCNEVINERKDISIIMKFLITKNLVSMEDIKLSELEFNRSGYAKLLEKETRDELELKLKKKKVLE